MIIIALSILLLVCYTLGNRLIGSPEWKKHIPYGRIVAYVSCALSCLGLLLFGGVPIVNALTVSVILSLTFLYCRQRSPRGNFFLHTGGKAGVWDEVNKYFANLYDGEHSPSISWLAQVISRVKWKAVIRHAIAYYNQGTQAIVHKKLRRYSFVHALLFFTLPLLLSATALYYTTGFSGLFCASALGLLCPIIRIQSGVNGYFAKEEGAGERAELLEGLFIHGLFALTTILLVISYG